MPFHDTSGHSDATTSSAERRVALVIGNGRYAHASELANPAKDAESMAVVLERVGFDVVMGIDLDLRAMGDVQAAFEAKLRTRPDVALLFYAGHGLQVRGKNYLIPIDAAITEMAHLASRALLFNDVLEPMAEGAGASLIFLDACRDNPFTRNLARTLGESTARSNAVRGGLAKVDKVAGTFIAYATAPDTVAYDGKGANSPFTGALLKHVERPGLSVADMMIDVRNAVLTETDGRQEPWDQSSLRARFYFVPKAQEPLVKPVISAAADEWAAIQHTTSLALLASFRERHSAPPWSTYADIRLAELREADAARSRETEAGQDKSIDPSASGTPERQALPPMSPKRPLGRKIGAAVAGLALAALAGVWWLIPPPPPPDPRSDPRKEEPAARNLAALAEWSRIKDTTDETQIEGFIKAHPDTPAADEAKARLASLRRLKDARAEAEWARIKETTDEDVIKRFIAAHGDAPVVAEAKTRLAALRSQREAKDRAQRNVAAAMEWNRGQATADEKWLEEFILRHPDTSVALAAKIKLANLRSKKGPHVLSAAEERALRVKDEFQECDACPRMVVVPAGRFNMGSLPDEKDRSSVEGPVHEVTIARPFAVGKFEVTFAEWEACAADGGCTSNRSPSDNGWGRDKRPVINVSWDDAKEYVAWLKRKTGKDYRLLTEAEWEYAARAGTRTRYSWGNDASHEFANYGSDTCCSGLAQGRDQWVNTAPVGQFAANAFGLHDLHGNVWEWVEDCYIDNYYGGPNDGSARTTGNCSRRVLRGGSWVINPQYLRSAYRDRGTSDNRLNNFGFRLARTLSP